IMAQYRPCYQANQFPELARPIHTQEYRDAIEKAQGHNLFNLD
ncbi:MAG: radical SAM protein, partial [bacterium]|nr:radical SAM protein [bacterium]